MTAPRRSLAIRALAAPGTPMRTHGRPGCQVMTPPDVGINDRWRTMRAFADDHSGGANGGADLTVGRLTPRQAQILGLAANGLSDKEIASRLGVAHRTVRTHLEKLFQDRGIRNRS